MTVQWGLILDIQGTQSEDHGERGIGRYISNHATALLQAGTVRGLVLNPTLPFPGQIPASLLTSPLLKWGTIGNIEAAAGRSYTAYHVMSPFELRPPLDAVLPPVVKELGLPVVTTLYDLIPLLEPQRYLSSAPARQAYEARLEVVRRADLVLAISEHTRADAIEHGGVVPDRVVTIGGGVSPFFHDAQDAGPDLALIRAAGLGITRAFVLCVSGADERKNTEALISAFALLSPPVRRQHQLVIVCDLPPEWAARWRGHAQSEGLGADEVVLTGRINDQLLRALYRCCVLFAFPSRYEGFGLPVAEAIACGAPAVTSDASSLPEILDWPSSTFDPSNPHQMAALISRALCAPDFRARLRDLGIERRAVHTWTAVAERTVAALTRLERPRPRRRRGESPDPRLALAGMFASSEDTVARRNLGLADALAARSAVDVFYVGAAPPTEGSGWGQFPISALGRERNPFAYDAIVYLVSDSPEHAALIDHMSWWPGIVWLDGFSMRSVFEAWAKASHPDGWRDVVRREVVDSYGDRVPRDYSGVPVVDAVFDREMADRSSLFLTGPAVRSARMLVTVDPAQSVTLAMEHGPHARIPDRLLIPLPPTKLGDGSAHSRLEFRGAAEALMLAVRRLRHAA